MALQPIYGENGEIVDSYDDGVPNEVPQEQHEETPPPSLEAESQAESLSQTWTVPDLLKETDLFIGTTIHHDDGNPRGPLISLFVRELPDGAVHVRTFRAAELSERAFLDKLQKGIAMTMQAHLLVRAEQQRRRLEEEAKRKARAPQTSTQTAPTSVPALTKAAPIPSPTTPAPAAQKPERKTTPEKSTEKKPKYATISMFD